MRSPVLVSATMVLLVAACGTKGNEPRIEATLNVECWDSVYDFDVCYDITGESFTLREALEVAVGEMGVPAGVVDAPGEPQCLLRKTNSGAEIEVNCWLVIGQDADGHEVQVDVVPDFAWMGSGEPQVDLFMQDGLLRNGQARAYYVISGGGAESS